jgi:hypothetical protein
MAKKQLATVCVGLSSVAVEASAILASFNRSSNARITRASVSVILVSGVQTCGIGGAGSRPKTWAVIGVLMANSPRFDGESTQASEPVGREQPLERGAQAHVVCPWIVRAGSHDAGKHGECQQCRDDDLHDAVSFRNATGGDGVRGRDNGSVLGRELCCKSQEAERTKGMGPSPDWGVTYHCGRGVRACRQLQNRPGAQLGGADGQPYSTRIGTAIARDCRSYSRAVGIRRAALVTASTAPFACARPSAARRASSGRPNRPAGMIDPEHGSSLSHCLEIVTPTPSLRRSCCRCVPTLRSGYPRTRRIARSKSGVLYGRKWPPSTVATSIETPPSSLPIPHLSPAGRLARGGSGSPDQTGLARRLTRPRGLFGSGLG